MRCRGPAAGCRRCRPGRTGSNPVSRISWATTGLACSSPDRNMTQGGSRWLSSAMMLTESELKARAQRACGNASASDRSVTCCCPNELAASIMTRPSSGQAACSTSVTAGPGTATSTASAPATASATEAACARSPSSAASARGRVACRAANVTSWPAACQSLPSVEPTRPAPRTAIFISLLPPSEAISCRDDEFAADPILLHVGVRLDRSMPISQPPGPDLPSPPMPCSRWSLSAAITAPPSARSPLAWASAPWVIGLEKPMRAMEIIKPGGPEVVRFAERDGRPPGRAR